MAMTERLEVILFAATVVVGLPAAILVSRLIAG